MSNIGKVAPVDKALFWIKTNERFIFRISFVGAVVLNAKSLLSLVTILRWWTHLSFEHS